MDSTKPQDLLGQVKRIDEQLKHKQNTSKLRQLKAEYDTLKQKIHENMAHIVNNEIEPAEDILKHLKTAMHTLRNMQNSVNPEDLQTDAYTVLQELSGNIDADLHTFIETIEYACAKTNIDAIRSDVENCTSVLIERIQDVIDATEKRIESSKTRLHTLGTVVEIPTSKFMTYDERVRHRLTKIQKIRNRTSEITSRRLKLHEQQRRKKRENDIQRRRARAQQLEALVCKKSNST